jgi:hypothetical protein
MIVFLFSGHNDIGHRRCVDMLLELYRHLVHTTCATVVVVSLVPQYDPSEEMGG